MCGRYVSATSPDDIAAYFDVDAIAETLIEPNYNVAPTAPVPVVRERIDKETAKGTTDPSADADVNVAAVRSLDLFVWGLVPFWAKDPKIGPKMINARAETLAEKGSFKRAFAKRRCIVPADGFYEWTTVNQPAVGGKKAKAAKQPWFIGTTDGSMMAFAGLYEYWRRPGATEDLPGETLMTCTIITTTANEKISPVHDRMPVLLNPSNWDLWLNPAYREIEHLQEMLTPAPSELFTVYPVSPEVNNARNAGEHLIEKIELPEAPVQGSLL